MKSTPEVNCIEETVVSHWMSIAWSLSNGCNWCVNISCRHIIESRLTRIKSFTLGGLQHNVWVCQLYADNYYTWVITKCPVPLNYHWSLTLICSLTFNQSIVDDCLETIYRNFQMDFFQIRQTRNENWTVCEYFSLVSWFFRN